MSNRRENIILAVIIFIILLIIRATILSDNVGFMLAEGKFSIKTTAILLAIREIPIWLFDFISFPLLIIYFIVSLLKPTSATFYNIMMSYLISTFVVLLFFVITKQIESIELGFKFYALTSIIIILSVFILLIPEKENTLS